MRRGGGALALLWAAAATAAAAASAAASFLPATTSERRRAPSLTAAAAPGPRSRARLGAGASPRLPGTVRAAAEEGRRTRSGSITTSSCRLGAALGEGPPPPSSGDSRESRRPMAFGSGYSTLPDLRDAIAEAAAMAVSSLPRDAAVIDAGWISVLSLYDGGAHSPAATVVPALLDALRQEPNLAVAEDADGEGQPRRLRHLIGSSVAGCISSSCSASPAAPEPSGSSTASSQSQSSSQSSRCRPVELEGVPAVSVTLAVLPGVAVESFCASPGDVPDGDFRRHLTPSEWRRAVGLSPSPRIASPAEDDAARGQEREDGGDAASPPPPVFFLIPCPAFTAVDLGSLVDGVSHYYPGSQVVGGVASTVSSLSRAKLYRWSAPPGGDSGDSAASPSFACVTDGCVGLALQGDVAVRQMTALGAKPVGGIYQVVKASDSTIGVIVLDEVATDALGADEESGDSSGEDESEQPEGGSADSDADDSLQARREKMSQLYAKARIPKPVLAEANFLMRTLSDDDQAFMRRQLLVGLEQGGGVGRSAGELARLASGRGHRFAVHPVASAGMKDGSVTLPLGSVAVEPGTRMRFFVREAEFAKKELDALWTGYKKEALDDQFAKDGGAEAGASSSSFTPAACFVVPTLDRGSKFFLGKPGYEGGTVARVLPSVASISGFFSNGVIGRIDAGRSVVADSADTSGPSRTGVQGSASGYFLWGPRSGRPVHSPAAAAAEAVRRRERRDAEEREARALADEDARRVLLSAQKSSAGGGSERAPRTAEGELVLKRREVHSGRALTVSTVEWSVAEKVARPSSALEGYMWEKETEVDRYRERVPLANLVSQCGQSASDPSAPKPRDWAGPLRRAAAAAGGFVVVPECKRTEPATGSLWRRYDVAKLVRECTLAGAPALSVSCDGVLFGGSLDDVTKARQASSAAAAERLAGSDDDGAVVPPILASDLVLYPYQLYRLRLAGADAVTLVAGALARKDLMYLAKIAASLRLQTLVTVTSEVQIRSLLDLPAGAFDGLIVSNRELEDFSFDMTGEQALRLLRSEALEELRGKMGRDLLVLAEGRVGIIERAGASGSKKTARRYVEELREAGAAGAVVGGGLAAAAATRATAEALDALNPLPA